MGLQVNPNVPVMAIVSRLVSHKGLDLICEVLHDMMELPMQLVILGKGDQKYEEFFDWAAKQYPGRLAVRLAYNEALSMAIYSGADLFLMPSKSEPCGLSQMIAMRYGTLPIVRETGGLKDSVQAYEAWRDSGNGFSFANYNSSDMLHVIQEAVELYHSNPEAFARLRQRAMECDFSWARSAEAYLRIYANITGQAWGAERPFEEAAPVEEKPVKKAAAKKTTAKKAAAKKETAEKKPAEKKPAAKKTTKKAKAEEVPAEAVAEEKPVKKTTRKKAVKEEPVAEEKKPAKKTSTAKKTTKKETPAEEPAEK